MPPHGQTWLGLVSALLGLAHCSSARLPNGASAVVADISVGVGVDVVGNVNVSAGRDKLVSRWVNTRSKMHLHLQS